MNSLHIRPKALPGLSILIADDDSDTIKTLSALLATEGYAIHHVYRGDAVLEAVRRYKPNVCILDIEMPGQSGYAAAQEILSQVPPDDRPFLIAISGHWTRTSEKILAESVGFRKFFTKPADPEELLDFLQEIAVGNP